MNHQQIKDAKKLGNIQSNIKCLEHSEPFVYVSSTNRGKCQKCVSKETGLTLLTDVYTSIDEVKLEASNKKKELSKQNIESLKHLIYQVNDLKAKQAQLFDKLLINLEQWIGSLDQGIKNYEEALKTIDVLSIKQLQQELDILDRKDNESHINFRQTILDRLQTILQESQIIRKFCEQIEYLQLESQNKTIDFHERSDQNSLNLNLLCDQEGHKQRKIIALDITSSNPNVERLGCAQCQKSDPTKYTLLEMVSEEWQSYQQEKDQKLQDYKSKYTNKIDLIQQEFLNLKQIVNQQIDQTSRKLSENLNHIANSIQEQLSGGCTDWPSLTKDQVKKIADTLSKQGKFQVENIADQNELEAQHYIQMTIMNLRKTFEHVVAKIKKITPVDSDNKINQYSQDNIVQSKVILADLSYNRLFSAGYRKIQRKLTLNEVIKIDLIKQMPVYQQNTVQSAFYLQRKEHPIFKNQQSLSLDYFHDKCSLLSMTGDEDDSKFLDILKSGQTSPIQIVYQQESCFALAFNKGSSTMVAGQGNKIKVFQFQSGRLIEIQVLSDHKDDVVSFYFMKQSQQFISGSCDATMRVWSLNSDSEYESTQQLIGHLGSVYCVIMNEKEDLLISSSWDKTIKFWKKNPLWECFQTLIHHKAEIQQISLNESQNTLLSCGEDNQLVISSLRSDGQWEVVQSIQTQDKVLRGCFIDNNVISFQVVCSNFIELYQFNEKNKQVQRLKEINVMNYSCNCVDYSSQQKYIKEKRILFNKSDSTIYLLKNNNNDLEIVSAFTFETYNAYGTLTEDGEYLVTWDDHSKMFQVQKMKYQ